MKGLLTLVALLAAATGAQADLIEDLAALFLDARLHEIRATTLDEYLLAREFREIAKPLRADDPDRQVDLELLRLLIDRKIAHFELEDRWAETPAVEALPSSRALDLALLLPPADGAGRLDAAAQRLRAPESPAARQLETMRAHLARVQGVFGRAVAGLREQPDGRAPELRAAAERLEKALERLRGELERASASPRAPPEPVRDPLRVYRFVIRHELFVNHTPHTLLDFATRSYQRTREQLEALAKKIDAGSTWHGLVDKSKADRFTLGTLHEESKKLALRARDFAVDKGLVTIPEAARDFDVRPAAPDAITPFGHYRGRGARSKGAYVTAPVSERMPAEELAERLLDNNRYWTTIVSLHEAVPGHHLQYEVLRTVQRARIRRAFAPPTYVEGWGLYTEQMMFQNGYFGGDPLFELTLLRMRLWRCARVVIDLGLQTESLTRDEAVRLLIDGVRMEPVSARAEVEHYGRRPGYFSGYLLGFDFFTGLRKRIEDLQGAKFSQRDFHDRILQLGPLPPAQLESLLLRWAKD